MYQFEAGHTYRLLDRYRGQDSCSRCAKSRILWIYKVEDENGEQFRIGEDCARALGMVAQLKKFRKAATEWERMNAKREANGWPPVPWNEYREHIEKLRAS